MAKTGTPPSTETRRSLAREARPHPPRVALKPCLSCSGAFLFARKQTREPGRGRFSEGELQGQG